MTTEGETVLIDVPIRSQPRTLKLLMCVHIVWQKITGISFERIEISFKRCYNIIALFYALTRLEELKWKAS